MARVSNLTMCSFCGKSHAEVLRLIAGPGVYICDRCITVCIDILDTELTKNAHQRLGDFWRTLKQYVIGLYRPCLEWFYEHVLAKLPSLPSAHTEQEEDRLPPAASFTFRNNTKYRIEISLGLYQCLVSNTTIIKQMAAFGFDYVNVVGAGRNRTIEAAWLHDDTPITVRSIEGKIETKSEFPLAELLEGIGNAEEVQPPKEIPSKR